jgi:hypothetical protein
MGLFDVFAGVAQDTVKATAELLVGRTSLLYQAGFASRAMDPVHDPLHLGPLHLTQSVNFGNDPVSPKLVMVPAAPAQGRPAGARLTVQWPLDSEGNPVVSTDGFIVGTAVHPFPPGLDLFKITARFEMAEGPHGVSDAWAAVLNVRKGAIPDTITDRKERIAVTLQAAFNSAAGTHGAKMNTPNGAPPGTAYPIPRGLGGGAFVPEAVRDAVYSMEPFRSGFTLELLVDRRADIARAGLTARFHSHQHVERRWFVHDLVGISKGTISAAGLNIAIVGGTGPASVTVTDFRIYSIRRGIFDALGTLPLIGTEIAGVLADVRQKDFRDEAGGTSGGGVIRDQL